ncbi:MAG: tetratricopeptide repeat protein [Anaerolineales bacterium]|nr:tetratricopeptide repeat protein [Anaerolineales bacterium]MCB9126998.1 tetratricopeptide repeat protein [Ardenticatenales bacterium]MCB9172374.1 tetratricopeptide repeat protein [Ardenticatenales bacterium]
MTMSIETLLQRQIANRAKLLLEQLAQKLVLSADDWDSIYRALEMALSAPQGWPQAKAIFERLLDDPRGLDRNERWMLLLMHGIEVSAAAADNLVQARLLLELGECYDQISEFERAEDTFLHSATLFRQEGHAEGEGQALNSVASLCYRRQHYSLSAEFASKSRRVASHIPAIVARSDLILGAIAFDQDEDDQAITYFRACLENSLESGEHLLTAKAYSNLGIIYRQIEDWKAAEALYSEAIHHANTVNDRIYLGVFHSNLGVVYFKTRRIEQALSSYHDALQELKRLGNIEQLAPLYNNIGMVYASMGELEAARRNLRASAELWLELKNQAAYDNVMSNILEIEEAAKRARGVAPTENTVPPVSPK